MWDKRKRYLEAYYWESVDEVYLDVLWDLRILGHSNRKFNCEEFYQLLQKTLGVDSTNKQIQAAAKAVISKVNLV